ncbi:MAG: hypothetical protein K0R72_648 [Clostridia bacterium]|jgi:hypothetical protein|nr:hypothetical protein [Clostridia bacterium]
MKNRRGSIEIVVLTLVIIFIFIILTAIFLLHIQINSCIYNVKSDLFYIAQNAYIAANYNELSYANYEFDNILLNEKIVYLLKLNHPNYKFTINEIKYEYKEKSVLIDINILVEPIILNNLIGNINLNIRDNFKLKLMEVKNGI